MGAKSKPKKKGPKGKRARAKAKLEQVWGETVDEDVRKASRLRFGKSRLMPETKEEKKIDHLLQTEDGSIDNENIAETFESYHSNSSSDSEDEDNKDGNVFSHFMKRIKNHDSRMMDDSDDSSEESESDDEQIESQSEDESLDEDDGPVTLTDSSLAQDPFETHFSKPPLPQLDAQTKAQNRGVQLVALTQNSRKVNTSILNSSVDVHLSGPILDQWDSLERAMEISDEKQPQERKYVRKLWEQFAKGPYDHAREVLTRNWKDVNKSFLRAKSSNEKVFSSLQLALYPAVSRYADVLMTAETRQVRYSYVSFT